MIGATEQKDQMVSPHLAGFLKTTHVQLAVIAGLVILAILEAIALWHISGSIGAIDDIKVMNYGNRGLKMTSSEIALDKIGSFARLFLSDLGNISADSAERKLKAASAEMSPVAAFRFESRMQKDVQAMDSGKISMQTLETEVVRFMQVGIVGTPTWDLIVRTRQRFFAAGALVGDRRVDIPVRVQEGRCAAIPCLQVTHIEYPELMTKRGEIVDRLLVP